MLLMTTVDNVNAEHVPYLIEQLMAKGAGNVHVVSAMTKKGRPEYILLIDTPKANVDAISGYLAAELGTLGIRQFNVDHISFKYSIETMKVSLRDVTGNKIWEDNVDVKLVKDDHDNPLTARVEYECVKTAAKAFESLGTGITFYELKQIIESKALKYFKNTDFEINIEPINKNKLREGCFRKSC
ncbi:nickel insertion protein [Sporomusa acidovorans]|uniref:Pyridinium-3,5-bisthiocarboxylic acid mononucleotide nickel insertion protein n=1 Tax=Sporomusa acidovorans (strain ATCC 49682 / DSM 3132 / Mol) TaxID=1123286 RepID=A0ABZ3J721_SPOA4|nr:nickel insertion protein [Sporomusa acidovorans]OZC18515.1 hypothetical protein SPACI_33810 [Sporomusa acidovorans DSM 3132]SDE37027.1 Protein of unknown function DUF111 [Sporomusa acidovorans]